MKPTMTIMNRGMTMRRTSPSRFLNSSVKSFQAILKLCESRVFAPISLHLLASSLLRSCSKPPLRLQRNLLVRNVSHLVASDVQEHVLQCRLKVLHGVDFSVLCAH